MNARPNFDRIAEDQSRLDAAIEARAADAPSRPVLARARTTDAGPESPKALPAELLPVEPFPMAALPEAFGPWVRDVAERMQCPPDFVAVPTLVAAASLAARHVDVRLRQRDDWSESANLWALIVGRPGVMKSPAMRAPLAPIERLEAQSAESFNDTIAQHKVEAAAAKLRAEALTRFLDEWEAEHGTLSAAELAKAADELALPKPATTEPAA